MVHCLLSLVHCHCNFDCHWQYCVGHRQTARRPPPRSAAAQQTRTHPVAPAIQRRHNATGDHPTNPGDPQHADNYKGRELVSKLRHHSRQNNRHSCPSHPDLTARINLCRDVFHDRPDADHPSHSGGHSDATITFHKLRLMPGVSGTKRAGAFGH